MKNRIVLVCIVIFLGGGVLWGYFMSPSEGQIYIRKSFLEIIPQPVESRVDDGQWDKADFIRLRLSPGTHTVDIRIPSGMKVFWAFCEGSEGCLNFEGGMVGPGEVEEKFFVSDDKVMSINFLFTPPETRLEKRVSK